MYNKQKLQSLKWFNTGSQVHDSCSQPSDDNDEYYAQTAPSNQNELLDKTLEIFKKRKEIHDKYNQVAKETI